MVISDLPLFLDQSPPESVPVAGPAPGACDRSRPPPGPGRPRPPRLGIPTPSVLSGTDSAPNLPEAESGNRLRPDGRRFGSVWTGSRRGRYQTPPQGRVDRISG